MMIRHAATAATIGVCALGGGARAQDMASARLQRIEAELNAQAERVADQERRLAEQASLIEAQSLELRALRAQRDGALAEIRAGRVASPATQLAGAETDSRSDALPARPVGEAPRDARRVEDVAAVPEGMGVLTPRGRVLVDPSFEFVRSSANRLVFRGVEIVPGINFGLIEADDVDRDSLVGALSARYGLTDRLEVELRAPYIYRHDRITTVEAAEPQPVEITDKLEGQGLGDIEMAARYQLNGGRNGWPIFVANGRVKTPTGKGPFDVDYLESVATELPVGSGFWAAEAGLTMLYPSDPAVIFAGLSYIHNFAADIDKTFGEIWVGRVDPGDSIGTNLGFGLALNQRFSVSLGYSHNYIFPTESERQSADEPRPTTFQSNNLQVGSLQMGLSFRLTDKITLNNNFDFGVTSDAPDMRYVLRVPYRF